MSENNTNNSAEKTAKPSFGNFFGASMMLITGFKMVLYAISIIFTWLALYSMMQGQSVVRLFGVSMSTVWVFSFICACIIDVVFGVAAGKVIAQIEGGVWGDDKDEQEALEAAGVVEKGDVEGAKSHYFKMFVIHVILVVIFGIINGITNFYGGDQVKNFGNKFQPEDIQKFEIRYKAAAERIDRKYDAKLKEVAKPYDAVIKSVISGCDNKIALINKQIANLRTRGANEKKSYGSEIRKLEADVIQARVDRDNRVAVETTKIAEAQADLNVQVQKEKNVARATIDIDKNRVIASNNKGLEDQKNNEAGTDRMMFWLAMASIVGLLLFDWAECVYANKTKQRRNEFIYQFNNSFWMRLVRTLQKWLGHFSDKLLEFIDFDRWMEQKIAKNNSKKGVIDNDTDNTTLPASNDVFNSVKEELEQLKAEQARKILEEEQRERERKARIEGYKRENEARKRLELEAKAKEDAANSAAASPPLSPPIEVKPDASQSSDNQVFNASVILAKMAGSQLVTDFNDFLAQNSLSVNNSGEVVFLHKNPSSGGKEEKTKVNCRMSVNTYVGEGSSSKASKTKAKMQELEAMEEGRDKERERDRLKVQLENQISIGQYWQKALQSIEAANKKLATIMQEAMQAA